MKTITVTKQINAPLDRVFQFATDFERAAQRVQGIDKVEMITDGPTRIGTKFRETRTMMGKAATEEMEVTQFNPPTNICLEAESCGCHYESWFHFTEKEGGTEVRMDFSGRPVTWLGKLMAPMGVLMAGKLKKMINADMDDLKAAAEATRQDS